MNRYIVLFFCITYCTTAMGQGWLIALLKCCTCVQNPQRPGIQVDAKLYKQGENTPISSDSRFFYKDTNNDYVPAYDPIEMANFNKENRITLDMPTIAPSNNSAVIKFTTRIGQGNRAQIEEKSVTVSIGAPTKETFEKANLYAIISASNATRDLQ